jgi:hypothetical protein
MQLSGKALKDPEPSVHFRRKALPTIMQRMGARHGGLSVSEPGFQTASQAGEKASVCAV